MKKKYIVPEIQVRHVKIKTFILSTTKYKMNLNKDNPITRSEEILTKGRTFYGDDEFGLGDW